MKDLLITLLCGLFLFGVCSSIYIVVETTYKFIELIKGV